MLKASALFYAIVMALIIAIICSSFILFSHFNRIQTLWIDQNTKLLLNASSGLNLLLSNSATIDLNTQITLDLFEEETDSVKLERRQWGAYEVAVSKAFFKNHESLKMALICNNIHSDNSAALYLANLDKPLYLCGNTKINGTCFLPKAGVKRGYIEGQSFIGEKLINGESLESENELPEINKNLMQSNLKYFNGQINPLDSLVMIEDMPLNDTITHSFKNLSLVLKSNGSLALISNFLRGNIRIVSDKSVFVGASAKLEDIIIYAPKIIIEEGFLGVLQLFASDTIIISKNCKLNYPSVLSINRTINSPDNIYASFGENSRFSGVILGYQENNNLKNNLKVSIDKNTIITGQVYVNGLVDLKGKVYGSVACRKFILITPSSVYENHLLNAVIDNTKLPVHFTGINIVSSPSSKSVVKWLN